MSKKVKYTEDPHAIKTFQNCIDILKDIKEYHAYEFYMICCQFVSELYNVSVTYIQSMVEHD